MRAGFADHLLFSRTSIATPSSKKYAAHPASLVKMHKLYLCEQCDSPHLLPILAVYYTAVSHEIVGFSPEARMELLAGVERLRVANPSASGVQIWHLVPGC
jgi:hypothetical protein